MRTGDFVVQLISTRSIFVVQLLYAEYLGSWKMRTGNSLVQLQGSNLWSWKRELATL